MPKKKKLTKKQKLKLLEIQKQEEEEALKKAEEERQLIIENEKKEKIRQQQKAIEKEEERKRLQIEEKKYFGLYLDSSKNKDKVIQANIKNKKWEQYLQCSNKYDIQKESDLNLMICFLEEKQVDSYEDLEQLLDMIQQSEETIREIQELILENEAQSEFDFEKYENFVQKIISINKKKIDEISNFVIQDSENIVKNYIEEQKLQNKQNQKNIESKPEIRVEFIRDKIKLAFWIMGFENNGIKPKPVEFLNLNFMTDIPKPFFNKSLILLVKQLPSNYYNGKAIVNNDQNLRLIYSIKDIACYKYPQESKKVGIYNMKRIFDRNEKLQKLTYQYYDNSSNFKVYINLPENLVLLPTDNLQFMYWDFQKQIWTNENIDKIQQEFNKELKKYFYSISIPQMAPVAVFTNKWCEFPYQHFQIRRTGRKTILFSLETLRNNLSFQITPGFIELQSCQNRQLNDLKNKKFTSQQLLLELAGRNVYLLTNFEEAIGQSGLMIKYKEVETFVLKEVSKACLYFHFQLSIWNQRTNRNSLILKMRENPEFDTEFHENTEIDWFLVYFKSYKCQILKILENSEYFSTDKKQNTESHLNLYYLTKSYPEYFTKNYYNENFTNDEILLIDTIEKFLQPLHLFSLSF